MLIDYSCTLDGDHHRIAILHDNGKCEIIEEFCTFKEFYDSNLLWFSLPKSSYYREDLRGDKSDVGKFFAQHRLDIGL